MSGRRTNRLPALPVLLVITLLMSACDSAGGVPTPKAPAIRVVTGLYPLAQAIQRIGTGAVAVTDVVPPGSDPLTYRLTPAQVALIRGSAVVVEIGGGFQPSFEAAASSSRVVLALRSALATTDPYVWLDLNLMRQAASIIASTLRQADAARASVYDDGARAFSDEVASTGIDYENTLSVCPRRYIMTADRAFTGLAHAYSLTDLVAGTSTRPSATTVSSAAQAARSAGVTTLFSEPFVAYNTIRAVASSAHLKVRTLDPLTGPPPGGWPRGADYFRLMEANLGALNAALGCGA